MPVKAKTIRQRQGPAPDRGRPCAARRGYDRAWSELRDQHLRENPLCALCLKEGRTEPAVLVDHVEPVVVNPARRLDRTNCRSLCRHHHAVVTARFTHEGINEPPEDRQVYARPVNAPKPPPDRYEHQETDPATTWTVTHGLNKAVSITTLNTEGEEIVGNVTHLDANTVRVTFNIAISGRAIVS